MPDANARGRFVWHELTTTDPKAATKFFTTIVGWKPQAWEQDPSYTLLMGGRQAMAGVMPLSDDAKGIGTPPNWLTYIYTPDVDDTVRQATSLGAKVVKPPTDLATVGRLAVIEDPQGAVFAAVTSLQGPQGEYAPGLGDFSWHELATTDGQVAFAFYQRLFGWEATSSMDMGPDMGTYWMFGKNGAQMGGIYTKPAQMQGPPSWLPYIRVQDSKKLAPAIKKLGGQIVSGPMEVPGGDWIVMGVDPQGGMFAVHSVKPAAGKSAAPARKRAASKAKKTKPAKRKAVTRAKAKKTSAKTTRKKAAKTRRPTARKAQARKSTARKGTPRKKTARKAKGRKGARRR